jgi:hypothetical protein
MYAYKMYRRKVEQLSYKDVKSALGNLYRAARDNKISIQQRDTLIALAKRVYSEKTKTTKERKLQWRGETGWALTTTLTVPDVGSIDLILKGAYIYSPSPTLRFLIADFLSKVGQISKKEHRIPAEYILGLVDRSKLGAKNRRRYDNATRDLTTVKRSRGGDA